MLNRSIWDRQVNFYRTKIRTTTSFHHREGRERQIPCRMQLDGIVFSLKFIWIGKMVIIKSFPAIEGMRTMFNFWVVALHQVMIQKCFLALYNRADLVEKLAESIWTGIALGNGFQVDIFFMLSAFLFTWGLINGQKSRSGIISNGNTLVLFIFKRILRLWPVLLAVLAIAYVANDYGARSPYAILKMMSISNYFDDIPQAAVPAWSNRVDIECCVVLFFVIKLLQLCGLLNTYTALLMVPISLVPKALRFLSDPDTFSYMRLGADVMTTAIIIPHSAQKYYRDVMYNETIPWFESMEAAPRMTPYFWQEYIVHHQRWSPAFVGFAMAVALAAAYTEFNTTVDNKKEKKVTVLYVLWRLWGLVNLVLCTLLAALPILMSLSPPTAEVRDTVLSNPPLEADFFVSVMSRTLNTIGWAYLLYRCLLPKGHDLRLNYLASFFELPLFQFMGKHSYCIYMLHYFILHVVNFSLLNPTRMRIFFGETTEETLFTEFIVRFLVTYGITFVLSMVIVRFIEQPFLRILQKQMKKLEAVVFGEHKKVV